MKSVQTITQRFSSHARKRRYSMVGVDLFAGAGGMSLGAKWAGIDVHLAIEFDFHAAETYKHNHRHTEIIVEDINKVKKIDVNSNSHHRILFGGPPCQGFSSSNQRTRTSDNPNNWLFQEFLRLLSQWSPEWVVFENVSGITETENGYFLNRVKDEMSSRGYKISSWILNAVDFGVPQRRSRLFVIGSLDGVEIPQPKPTVPQSRYMTVGKAISDLPDLKNGASDNWLPYKGSARSRYARILRGRMCLCPNHLVTYNSPLILKRYSHVPQGGNWKNIPARLMRNYTNRHRCHTGIYRRLNLDEPSVVIGNYRKNMLIHPTQNRGFSVREAARIQSFPDWYEFKGSIGFQQQQVGNSVPPLLANAVFSSIIQVAREYS